MTGRALALCGPRRRFLKIDCLLNAPPGRFQTCIGRVGVRAQNCVTRTEQKRCCTENTAPCSRGSARLRISRPGLREGAPLTESHLTTVAYQPAGHLVAQTMAHVLRQCGDNLTRENVMKQAANLQDFRTTNLLPGITINTSPIDFAPIKQVRMRRFKGDKWELFGPILSSEIGG